MNYKNGLVSTYDTGNSMFCRSGIVDLKYVNPYKIEVTPFLKTEVKILKLVKNRMVLDLSITDMYFSIYSKFRELEDKRVSELERLFNIKKETLRKFQEGNSPCYRNN